MSNISVKNHVSDGKNTGIAQPNMQFPYIDDFFDKFTSSWPFARPSFGKIETTDFSLNPKVDITEDDKSYKLSAELPGLDLENINLDLSDGVLTLSGEKETEKKEDNKEGNYHVMERSYGSFKRSFSIPPSVEEDKIKADFKKGVLSVSMPKSEKAQKLQRKISIKE
jgi:HSP20 family protein